MLIRITIGIWFIVTLLLCAIPRGPLPHVADSPPPDYRLGQPLPGNAMCYYWGYTLEDMTCGVHEYNFIASYPQRLIAHVSYFVYDQHLTVGTLILAWGTPDAVRGSGYWHVLYWRDRYVYVIGVQFSPFSRVSLIVWDTERQPVAQWRGFTNSP